MPDLISDVVGRVNRLALRPNERGALTPLLEAVSNSVFSVTDRFDDQTAKQGRITVQVVRDLTLEEKPVVGFEITDNGAGFNEANYQSFRTPDSRLKEKKGGKGVGRLAWLKVFEKIRVESTFSSGAKLYHRQFNFRLAEKDQIETTDESEVQSGEIRTTVSFRNFLPPFSGKCPIRSKTISNRLMSHFVPLFVAGNSPKIIFVDEDEYLDIEAAFADGIIDQKTSKIPFDFDGENVELQVWSLKCKKSSKFDVGGFNFAFITGDNRSVIDYCIDDQIGLKLLEGEFVYVGCVSGDYLDRHVNSERTAFTLDKEIDEVKKSIAKEARAFLSPYVEQALTAKVATTREIVIENPQFLYVMPDLKQFAEKLQPNVFKKEEIFVELSRDRFRRQKRFETLETEIAKTSHIDEALKTKIDHYKQYVQQAKTGALAEYVMRRKAVIDLFEKFLEYKDVEEGTYDREDAIHQLICPMRTDTDTLEIEDHNLWLIDDRLAFFNYFASDKPIQSYANVASRERPDLAFFYDSCVAWRQGENTDSVVIVEFKRPMRTDYAKDKDPVQQVLRYVKQLKEESSVPDIKGRAIRGIREGTAFHCYIVADITEELEDRIIGRFSKTPDGEGYFGYTSEPSAFVEIVPYGKLLNDARLRNTVFFQHLGITNTG